MKRLGLFLLLLLLSAALAVGGWWLYQGVLRPWLQPRTFDLEAVDKALETGQWTRARDLLLLADLNFSSFAEGKRLIARAQKLAKGPPGDWETYLRISASLMEAFPGSAEAAFLQAYGLLRAGRVSEASALVPRLEAFQTGPGSLDPDLLDPLVREIRLRAEVSYPGREDDPRLEVLTQVLGEGNLDHYRILQPLMKDPGILQNTLLLHLKEGNYPQVLGLLNKEEGSLHTPLLKALIYYDAAQWERAFQVLRSLEAGDDDLAYHLLLADLTMHLSGAESAAVVYRKMVSSPEDPVLKPLHSSPLPYLNLATMLEDLGGELELEEALRLLRLTHREGMEALIPDAAYLRDLFQRELEYRLGGTPAVADRLLSPDLSPDEEILRYRLFPEYLSLPRLFVLFRNTQGPAQARTAEALVWNLVLVRDYEKALGVLSQWENSSGGTAWWSSYYRALIYSLLQDTKKAETALEDVPPRWRDFGYFYNKGLILWAQGDAESQEKALEAWEEGRTALTGLGIRSLRQKDGLFSRLYYRLAGAFEVRGDLAKAREYSNLARRLDESNHPAYFLEKRLNADEELINDEIEEPGTD